MLTLTGRRRWGNSVFTALLVAALLANATAEPAAAYITDRHPVSQHAGRTAAGGGPVVASLPDASGYAEGGPSPPGDDDPERDNGIIVSDATQASLDNGRVDVAATATDSRTIPVSYCTRDGSYTMADLEAEVGRINARVAPFYRHQSSGHLEIVFEPAEIVTPLMPLWRLLLGWRTWWPWYEVTFDDFGGLTNGVIDWLRKNSMGPCVAEVFVNAKSKEALVIVDFPVDTLFGYATVDGTAVVAAKQRIVDKKMRDGLEGGESVFYHAIAHELGHSLFHFAHTNAQLVVGPGDGYEGPFEWDEESAIEWHLENVYKEDACYAVMYAPEATWWHKSLVRHGECPEALDLNDAYVVCGHRQKAGWPTGPAPPKGEPCKRVTISDGGSAKNNRRNGTTKVPAHKECEGAAICRNIAVTLEGTFDAPHELECWFEGATTMTGGIDRWSGNTNSGCYFWGHAFEVYVVVDGVKSNVLSINEQTV